MYAPFVVKRFCAVALVALTFAPVAHALDGMQETPALEPAASWIAGKPARVFCATDLASWDVTVRRLVPGRTGADTGGFANRVGGDELYLSPTTCLRFGLHGLRLGEALQLLVHESLHLAGMSDEWATDCTATSDVWAVAWIFFAVRQPELADVYAGALGVHTHAGPVYNRGYC